MARDPVHVGYEDGYMGGSELPSDVDIDSMIFPERPAPPKDDPYDPKETWEARQARQDAEAAAEEQRRYREGRSLTISEEIARGAPLAPPSKP